MSGKLVVYTAPISTPPESNYGLQSWFVQNYKLKLNVLLVTYHNGSSPFFLPPKIPVMSFGKADLVEALEKKKKRGEKAFHSINRNWSSSSNVSLGFQAESGHMEKSCLVLDQKLFLKLTISLVQEEMGEEAASSSFMKTVQPSLTLNKIYLLLKLT